MSILGIIIGPIVSGVLEGLQEIRAIKQFETMQAEILEGWIFKIKVEIEREARKHDLPFEAYSAIMAGIDKIVKEEFDTRQL